MHNDLQKMQILDLVSKGHGVGDACVAVGVPRDTFQTWLKRDATLKEHYRAAREVAGKARRKRHGDPALEPPTLLPADVRTRLLDGVRRGGTLAVSATAAGLGLDDFNTFMRVGREEAQNKQDSQMAELYRDVLRAAGEARLTAETTLLQDQPGFYLIHSPMGRETPEVPGWHRSEYRRIDATNKFSGKVIAEWSTGQHPQIVEAGSTLALPGPQADPFSLTDDELAEIDAEVEADLAD